MPIYHNHLLLRIHHLFLLIPIPISIQKEFILLASLIMKIKQNISKEKITG